MFWYAVFKLILMCISIMVCTAIALMCIDYIKNSGKLKTNGLAMKVIEYLFYE